MIKKKKKTEPCFLERRESNALEQKLNRTIKSRTAQVTVKLYIIPALPAAMHQTRFTDHTHSHTPEEII